MTSTDAATRYAGLAAIAAGVRAAQEQATADLAEWSATSGVSKGTVQTPFGPVTLRENKEKNSVSVHDEDAFIAWAREQHPDAVERVERIRPLDRDAILSERFVVVAGAVVDSVTGEAVPFARVVHTDAAPPSPSYGASEQQRAAKKAAIAWATERAGVFVDGVRHMLALPKDGEQ